jgi:hypothetical protein
MTPRTRIVRLELAGRTLLRRLRHTQGIYESAWLCSAADHLTAMLADLGLARVSATVRRDDDTLQEPQSLNASPPTSGRQTPLPPSPQTAPTGQSSSPAADDAPFAAPP